MKKTILVIGTYDTKNDELSFISKKIVKLGGNILTMDVSVLGDPVDPTDISKQTVAEAAGLTIDDAKNAGDEKCAPRFIIRFHIVVSLFCLINLSLPSNPTL